MKYSICLLLFFLSLYSCSGQTNNTLFIPKEEIKIQRFDIDFYRFVIDPSIANQRDLEAKYKEFLPAFGRVTINNSDSYKQEFFERLRRYFSNELLSRIYNDALKKYENTENYEKELSDADAQIAFLFNGKHLPSLFMHISGFKENVMVLDNIISLSIDKYLGADYPVYKQFFEDFQLLQMQPEMIVRDYIKAWLLSENTFEEKKKTLLSAMIREGKILYALSQILPDKSAENLIGYTPEQIEWCRNNESKIWKSIIHLNHLYDQNSATINKYINEAPYTATLTTDSPGRLGIWVGWQIVAAYANKNTVSLTELFNTESQQILKKSEYNP